MNLFDFCAFYTSTLYHRLPRGAGISRLKGRDVIWVCTSSSSSKPQWAMSCDSTCFCTSVINKGALYIAIKKRGGRYTIVYDDLLWNALVVERASKQFGHVHTFHRSTSSVGLAGADGEFPVTRAATELMHDLRRKKSTTISPALWLLSFLCSS